MIQTNLLSVFNNLVSDGFPLDKCWSIELYSSSTYYIKCFTRDNLTDDLQSIKDVGSYEYTHNYYNEETAEDTLTHVINAVYHGVDIQIFITP